MLEVVQWGYMAMYYLENQPNMVRILFLQFFSPTGGLINDVVQTARAGEDILKVGTKRLDNHIPLAKSFLY